MRRAPSNTTLKTLTFATIVAGVLLLLDGGFTLWSVLQSQGSGPQRTVVIK